MNRRPELEITAPGATPEEAAAVVAALERFMRDHAPTPAAAGPTMSGWLRAALREGVDRGSAAPSGWSERSPWVESGSPGS